VDAMQLSAYCGRPPRRRINGVRSHDRTSEGECRRKHIEDARETGNDELLSMGDMTQLLQMRLQKYQDAYTKMFEILSNVLKRISETRDVIAQNIK
jgi:hypothetical protein